MRSKANRAYEQRVLRTRWSGTKKNEVRSLYFFVTVVFAGLLAWGLGEIWMRWRTSRMTSSQPRAPLEPESRFVVRLSDSEVVCERPDGTVERVGWDDLQRVDVVTTSDGPFAPDVFWVLHGRNGGCAIPQGATGDGQLLARLQALPGFDNNAVTAAMASTSDRRFLCWARTSPAESA